MLVFGAIFLLLVCSLVVAILLGLISWPTTSQRPTQMDTEDLLVQDPHCGRYLAREDEDAVTESIDGRTLFFCSRFCRLRYAQRQKRRHPDHNTCRHPPEHLQQ